jgi:hypothetical protein
MKILFSNALYKITKLLKQKKMAQSKLASQSTDTKGSFPRGVK